MTENPKVEFITIRDAPDHLRHVFGVMASLEPWWRWRWASDLETLVDGASADDIRAAGRWLGDRVMLVRNRPEHARRLAVLQQRGRWACMEEEQIGLITGEIKPLIYDEPREHRSGVRG